MVGLCMLLMQNLNGFSFLQRGDLGSFTNLLSTGVSSIQTFLNNNVQTDIIKLISYIWLLVFLTPVFSGNKPVSILVGGIFFIGSFIMMWVIKLPVYTIGNRLFFILSMYFGWYIMANANFEEREFSASKTVICFFFSRMFIGFALIIAGISSLSRCVASVEIFTNLPNSGYLSYFLWGNGCILVGMLLLFANRLVSGAIAGMLGELFVALMILQLPTIILFFKGQKELIGTYYSNTAFHWSMIVSVIAYAIVSIIILMTSLVIKSNDPDALLGTETSETESAPQGWVCTECGHNNENGTISCKGCGHYK